MKAFLLAAGLGTRLRPLTTALPKCLVTVGGTTLLDIWLDALADAGVDDVLVNTHHLGAMVRAHVAGRTNPRVVTVDEPVLLGSAGTLRANRSFVDGDDLFLALNADNLTSFDVGRLVAEHRRTGAVATLTTFRTPRPSECGIVDVDPDGVVVGFVEKPAVPPGDRANAGMYAFSPQVLDEIVGPDPQDIGFDLLPRLVGRARAFPVDGAYFADIGTPEALDRARRDWKGRHAS